MFLESYPEGPASLPNIFHVTVGVCESIDSAIIQLAACFISCFVTENSADGIVSGERNLDWEVLKQLCDIFGLFSHISKLGPFLCILVFLFFYTFNNILA